MKLTQSTASTLSRGRDATRDRPGSSASPQLRNFAFIEFGLRPAARACLSEKMLRAKLFTAASKGDLHTVETLTETNLICVQDEDGLFPG
jgi:hypothetical protein